MEKMEFEVSSRKKKLLGAIWILGWFGLIVATELTWVYYKSYGDPSYHPGCEINATIDCKAVALSPYSRFLGLPNSIYGIAVYSLVLILIPFRLKSHFRIFKHLELYLALLALVSFVMSVYLAYISFFVLHTICIWCTTLYGIDLLFLVLAILALDKPGKIQEQISEDWKLLRTEPRVLGLVLVLAASGLTIFIILFYRSRNQIIIPPAEGPAVTINIKSDPVIGPSRAPVTIIEFSDFQCPYCRETATAIKNIQKKYPTDVRLVFKNFPLDGKCNPMLKGSPHPDGCFAAIASECAHKMGKFEPMYDRLMSATNYSPEAMMGMAGELGLDLNEFGFCLKSGPAQQEVFNDIADAMKLDIKGTPLLIINGRKYEGALSESQLELIIKRILEGKEPPGSE